MKKVFLAFSAIAIAVVVQAQIGVKGGVNLSSWRGDDAEGTKAKVGFYGGVFYNFKIQKSWSMQPELVFSAEGAQSETNSDFKFKWNTNFLNFTPLLRYNTSSGFFIGTAPQLGFLLTAKRTGGNNDVDVKDSFKGINFSWAVAAGYEFKNGFGFNARYNFGLSNISDISGKNTKTGVFQFGLRYAFNMDKK